MRLYRLIFDCLLVALAAGLAMSQQVLPSRLVRVALFKQGYGVVIREVTLPAGETESIISDVPVPVHGTFWLTAPQAVQQKSVVAAKSDRQDNIPAITLPELLRANIGERIEINTGNNTWVAGKLLSVADDRRNEDKVPPEIPAENRYGYYSSWNYRPLDQPSPRKEPANLLVIETADGPTAIPVSSVVQIRKGPGTGALKTTFAREESGAVLRLRTSGPGGTMQIAYITRGLTWAPSYLLDLHGKSVTLTGKAVIVNDAEDISTPELSCIAGFPNLKFAHVIDPLALKESVSQFLQSLQSPADNDQRPSVMTQAVMSNAAYVSPGQPLPAPDPTDTGDLHFYKFSNVNLQQGERAYLPFLESVTFPATEVYRWDARDLREDRYRYYDQRDNNAIPLAEDVWHAVRVRNTGKITWTTAPVMVMEDGQFLGQDILYYTSAGGTALINITKAVDVKAKFSESTLESTETVNINDVTYRKYIIAGQLTVTNYKDESVHLVINKKLTGDIIATSLDPAAVNEAPRTDIANAHNTVIWELDIPAGKTTQIAYKYKIFVR